MLKKNEGQAPEIFPTNIEENHPQLHPTEEDQTSESKSTENEQIGQPVIRKSTGPITEFGKQRSSKNAIKSGIFSRATLIKGESRAEFQSMRAKLWKGKQPGDEYEELILDMVASNMWRQCRQLIAEGAEIRRNSEFLEFDCCRKERSEAEEIGQSLEAGKVDMFAREPVALISNIHNPVVIQRCIELLVELRRGIETNGFDKERDRLVLKRIYGESSNPHLQDTLNDEYSFWLKAAQAAKEQKESEEYYTRAECQKIVLRVIGAEIKWLKEYLEQLELIEHKRRQVEILRQRVPESLALDRLLRYRNSLEREFYRLLAEYDRAQRVRKGLPLPPQLDVKIS